VSADMDNGRTEPRGQFGKAGRNVGGGRTPRRRGRQDHGGTGGQDPCQDDPCETAREFSEAA
jgi:hypothetical protein